MPKKYSRYYEPFIGGGALLLDVKPEKAIINDTNKQLLNIYRQLKEDSESVIEILRTYDRHACDKAYYLKMREEYNKKIISQTLDAQTAALAIWINKHCFNGLYRVNTKGLFNVPYNNKTSGVSMNEDNLRQIGVYLSKSVELREGDFENACKDVKEEDFVYFDSPYIPVSDTANFTDYTKEGFGYEDHCRLATLYRRLNDIGAKIMLSNNNVPLVHELYKEFYVKEIDVKRAINRDATKRTGKEVIVTNFVI